MAPIRVAFFLCLVLSDSRKRAQEDQMLSFTNANTNDLVNDRLDRMNVAGIRELCVVGLQRSLRIHANRALRSSAYLRGCKSPYQLAHQGAIRAVKATLPTALGWQRTWRPERPFRLLAFACTP